MAKIPCVYIMASRPYGYLYVGVTSDLPGRVWQHKEGFFGGWSKWRGTKTLVWYEHHDTMLSAIDREKTIKKWCREWKFNIIKRGNPEWKDLYPSLFG